MECIGTQSEKYGVMLGSTITSLPKNHYSIKLNGTQEWAMLCRISQETGEMSFSQMRKPFNLTIEIVAMTKDIYSRCGEVEE